MEEAAELGVPLVADLSYGPNWDDLTDLELDLPGRHIESHPKLHRMDRMQCCPSLKWTCKCQPISINAAIVDMNSNTFRNSVKIR